MAIKEIDNFRLKYPQYKDIDDLTLANKLADKYPESYGDLPERLSIEEPKYKRGERSLIGNVFERPGAAIRSGLISAKEGKGFIEGYKRGAVFPEEVESLGFVGDILTDPTTYIPFGGLSTSVGRGLVKGAGKGIVSKIVKETAKQSATREKFAEGLTRSVLGTKDLPVAKAISQERFIANSAGDLLKKMKDRNKDLLDKLTKNYLESTEQGVKVNVGRTAALKPLYNLRQELAINPSTNAAAIKRLQGLIDDISGFSSGKLTKFNELSPIEAHAFKQRIGDLINWNKTAVGENVSISNAKVMTKAMRSVYRNIDNAIDEAVPSTKQLNYRVSNLIRGIESLDKKVSRSKPFIERIGPFTPLQLPFEPLKSTALKTRLSSGLVKGYEKSKGLGKFKFPSKILSEKKGTLSFSRGYKGVDLMDMSKNDLNKLLESLKGERNFNFYKNDASHKLMVEKEIIKIEDILKIKK